MHAVPTRPLGQLHALIIADKRKRITEDTPSSYQPRAVLAGIHEDEGVLYHQRQSLQAIEGIDELAVDRFHGELANANLLAYTDPSSTEAESIIESDEAKLWVPTHAFESWPRPAEGPSYLDLLHSKISLRVEQGALADAAEIGFRILTDFYPSPYVTDNIVSLHSIAEVHARDRQTEQMEHYLGRAERLILDHQLQFYIFDANRIRGITADDDR